MTIEDVAARAGVSVATVSRALRGLPNVAPRTREKVRAVAEELAYRPDPNASRLAAGRSWSVGIAVPLLGQWYFSQVVAGAEAVLSAEGYDLTLFGVAGDVERKRLLKDWALLHKRVDALVLVDVHLEPDEVEELAAGMTRVVTVGESYADFASVSIDNHGAAMTAVRHLVNLGHREIGLIGQQIEGPLVFSVPEERRAGYRAALEEAGLDVRPELDVPGNFSIEGGEEAMTRLLTTPRPPTAVFAMSDEMAFGALKAVRDHGLAVPDDISIVGFDDHELAEVVGLTTIRQPVAEIGAHAARFALLAVEGDGGATAGPPSWTAPTSLVVRASARRVVVSPSRSRSRARARKGAGD